MSNDAIQTIIPGLWLVATPIGNLQDMTTRSVAVLSAAHVVCCEDTRHSGRLLKHIGAHPERLIVANDHTEHDATSKVLEALAAGHIVALITDAGTPGISDPGERIARAAITAGYFVSATPGPAAFVMAVIISGFSTTRIAFDGFLPRAGAERRQRLTEITRERRTLVLYEAPHRLAKTIADLIAVCDPERRVVLARELTKMHEETWRGTLTQAMQHVSDIEPRGEYVIVLEGVTDSSHDVSDDDIAEQLRVRKSAGLSTRQAVDEVSSVLGIARKRVYDLAIQQ